MESRCGPHKHEVVALEGSFHGRTLGALSITGQPKYRADFEPLLPGARFVPRQDVAALEAAVNENTAAHCARSNSGRGRNLSGVRKLSARKPASWPTGTMRC